MKKKLVILGGSGFIGKNMVFFFSKKKKYKIIATYLNNKPKINNVKFVKCDLTKKENVDKIIKGSNIIIQAAATTSGAKDIVNKPYIHVNDNAIINSMVTRSAFDHNVEHLIVFSCTVMYNSSYNLLKEKDFNPNKEMYPNYFGAGWMKVFVEKMCEFYSRLGRNKYTIIRHSNIYGPHDKFDLEKSHVFGATINKVCDKKNKIINVWGKGEEIRDFLYVSDLVNFVNICIKKQKSKYALYNVGSGKALSVNDLIKKIMMSLKKSIPIKHDLSKKSLKTRIILDCSKAKKELGWFPKVSLKKGIKKTIKWYLKNQK